MISMNEEKGNQLNSSFPEFPCQLIAHRVKKHFTRLNFLKPSFIAIFFILSHLHILTRCITTIIIL